MFVMVTQIAGGKIHVLQEYTDPGYVGSRI
jgi:hypothetical protein